MYCFGLFQTSDGIRFRSGKSASNFLPLSYDSYPEESKYVFPLPSTHLIALFFGLSCMAVTIVLLMNRLPQPLMLSDELNNPGRFIAERARNYLVNLTSFGPRTVGSYENEVLAVKYLIKEINLIQNYAKSVHKLSVDIQKPTGTFPLLFLDGMTSFYRNVQNVVVKLSSHQGSLHSVLVNCHFDTVVDSPGKMISSLIFKLSYLVI